MSLFCCDSFTCKIEHLSLIFIIFKHFVPYLKVYRKILFTNGIKLIWFIIFWLKIIIHLITRIIYRIITEKVDKEIKYRSNIYFLKWNRIHHSKYTSTKATSGLLKYHPKELPPHFHVFDWNFLSFNFQTEYYHEIFIHVSFKDSTLF